MQRERVADDIYVFTSEVYAQVTAGVIVSSDGAILIDTNIHGMEPSKFPPPVPSAP